MSNETDIIANADLPSYGTGIKSINAELDETKEHAEFVTKIKKELVEKNYYDDVKSNLASKSRWKTIGDLSEAFSHILTGISAVLAFAAGFFDHKILSFVAGCLATGSLVLLQFSSYSMKESKERTDQVNKILDKLGIEEIANITVDSTGAMRKFEEV